MSDGPTPGQPTQAVILAGGRGARLRPLTDDRPKPMIALNGRPFVEYLLELLRDQGIERVLLLLGYRAEVLQAHVGDGARWGISVESHVTPPEFETAQRLRFARSLLDPTFLMLYADNYWPLDLAKMWARRQALGAPAMVTVYRNRDGWSRGHNILVDPNGFVTAYDRTRQASGLGGVEIGYAILDRSTLEFVTKDSQPIEHALYPHLIAQGELAGFVTEQRYYSIGSLERIPVTEAFLARRPTLILDRDGVLNVRPPRATYVRTPEDFEWLPGAVEAMRDLTQAGYRLLVISNQAGVARGAMSRADLAAVEARMARDLASAGARVDAFYYCTHDWDEGCECRKPLPGLFFAAQRDFELDLSRTPYIGDDDRDRQAAEAAGAPFIMVDESHPLRDVARDLMAQAGRDNGAAAPAVASTGSAR